MTIELPARSWREARGEYGKIKNGQVWINRKNRNILMVERKDGDKYRLSQSNGRAHLVGERDLYKYFDLIS